MHTQGTIRRWDSAKGFGFIQGAHSSNVFFHVRDYRGATPPAEGMRVEFEEIQVGSKGPRAMAVRPLGALPLPSRQPGAAPRPRPVTTHRPAQAWPWG